jgi:ABC-type sugar transport system ATPase subunit
VSAAAPVLSVEGATKRFGAVLAVDNVSLQLNRREILAVVGDNGAGKSTLIKCISGVHRLDDGEVLIDGTAVSMRNPHDSRRHGIETVYQDLALFDELSVWANLFGGREIGRPNRPAVIGWMNNRAMRGVARETFARLEVRIPSLQTPVNLLSGGQRQAVAVARAITFGTRVVILDEPTAALGVRETRNVLRMIKGLSEKDVSVVLISHNLDQVTEIADRVIVMRRGRKIGEADAVPENQERIVSMIVGVDVGRPDPVDAPR